MSIVFITIEGESKIEFANSLHEKTAGAVSLVIVQKRPLLPFWKRVRTFFRKNNTIRAIYFATLLYFNLSVREKLDYFRYRTKKVQGKSNWIPPTITVASVNDDVVLKKISELAPSLIVVWGSGILNQNIIQSSGQVINLHLGLAPYYRGAVANQFAVFNDDINRIGATIHYVSHGADTGDIIETILPDVEKSPKEMFGILNDKAEERFLDIAVRLYGGEKLPRIKQDQSISQTFLLKQWTPEIRYKVGEKISKWEKSV